MIKDLINEGMALKPKDKWPTYDGKELDRSMFVTASEIGHCARRVWFGKAAARGDNAPAEVQQKWGFFERGHNVEAWVVSRLRAYHKDYEFRYVGDEQRSFYLGNQSCTPDGIMRTPEGEYILLEIKSIDPRTNIRNLPKRENKWQVQQNMDIISACLDIEINRAFLIYVECSDYMNIYEFELEADFEFMETLEARANKIIAARKAKDVAPEGLHNGGCRYCTFTDQCNAHIEVQQQEQKTVMELKNDANKLFGR